MTYWWVTIRGAILCCQNFQNGCQNTASKWAVKIQHCPISSKFDMWVDNDVPNWFPTSNNFYRSPFSKWLPQYLTNSTLFDFNEISYVDRLWVLNWFPSSQNFFLSPFSKWPPQYRKKSSSEFVTMQSVHLNLLSVAGLGDFIIVR